MEKEEIYEFGGKAAFKCAGCNKTVGGFANKKEASLALQLHKIGCKKS